jgi:hypothetical protein
MATMYLASKEPGGRRIRILDTDHSFNEYCYGREIISTINDTPEEAPKKEPEMWIAVAVKRFHGNVVTMNIDGHWSDFVIDKEFSGMDDYVKYITKLTTEISARCGRKMEMKHFVAICHRYQLKMQLAA